MRTKDRPIGAAIPVSATADERKRLAFKAFKLLEMPPINVLAGVAWSLRCLCLILTFIYNQY